MGVQMPSGTPRSTVSFKCDRLLTTCYGWERDNVDDDNGSQKALYRPYVTHSHYLIKFSQGHWVRCYWPHLIDEKSDAAKEWLVPSHPASKSWSQNRNPPALSPPHHVLEDFSGMLSFQYPPV